MLAVNYQIKAYDLNALKEQDEISLEKLVLKINSDSKTNFLR